MVGIGIAATRIFLILLWITAVSAIATVAFYILHFKIASRVVGALALVTLVLTIWAYFSIWGFVWVH